MFGPIPRALIYSIESLITKGPAQSTTDSPQNPISSKDNGGIHWHDHDGVPDAEWLACPISIATASNLNEDELDRSSTGSMILAGLSDAQIYFLAGYKSTGLDSACGT